jgi:hypothetical protein
MGNKCLSISISFTFSSKLIILIMWLSLEATANRLSSTIDIVVIVESMMRVFKSCKSFRLRILIIESSRESINLSLKWMS